MKTRLSLRIFLPALSACLWLSACVTGPSTGKAADPPPGSAMDSLPEEIAAARARWKENEPVRYSYTMEQKAVWISWKVRVTAYGDSVVAAESLEEPGPGIAPVSGNLQAYAIDSLFARIRTTTQDGPAKMEYDLDPTYGFPAREAFGGLPDTHVTLTVSDFRVEIAR